MYTILKIQNIENLYNYRAYLDENGILQIETSVLSNQNETIKFYLKINIDSQELNYELPNKEKFEDILTPAPLLSGFEYIKNKKVAMNYAFSLRKKDLNKKGIYRETPLTRYFSPSVDQNRIEIREENINILGSNANNVQKPPPQFCRVGRTESKEPCKSCSSEPVLSIDRLGKNQISITIINDELKNHFHPTFRPGRKKNEAVKELIYHYHYAHNVPLPENTI